MEELTNKTPSGLESIRNIAHNEICNAIGRSGIGGRKENQDSYSGFALESAVLLTVCDGMGGMAGGQTASRIAVTEIIQNLAEKKEGQTWEEAIKYSVESANAAIYRRAMDEPKLRGMGTTATVLVLTSEAAYLTHIGDSRIYQLRKGKKVFRTFDHSRVFEMVEQGLMTEEQARQSSFSNIITRALGIRPSIEMNIEKIPYKKNDRFILCCDGIWNTEAEPDMLNMFTSEVNTEKAISLITEKVDSIGFENGGEHDNLTIIIADMNKDSDYQYSCMQNIRKAISRIKFRKSLIKKNRNK